MRLFSSSYFWILVCLLRGLIALLLLGSIAKSATTADSPPKNDSPVREELQKSGEASPVSPDMRLREESLGLGVPTLPSPPGQADDFQVAIRPSQIHDHPNLGLHGGFLTGKTTQSDESTQGLGLGAGLYFDWEHRPIMILGTKSALEAELNLQSDRNLSAGLSQRWILTSEGWNHPYIKAGLFNHIAASDFVAGLINIQHFKIRGAIGLADVSENHDKFYFESGLSWGLTGLAADFRLGQTFTY